MEKKIITNEEHKKLNQILKDLEPSDKANKLRSILDDVYFRERPDNLKVFTKSPYYPIEKKV